jgi:hypothetical protein
MVAENAPATRFAGEDSRGASMDRASEAVKASVAKSLADATVDEAPYRHWTFHDILPAEIYRELRTLAFPVADLGGLSGTRDAHNADRIYFAGGNLVSSGAARATAEAFQDAAVVGTLADDFGAEIEDTYLRIEYAQDADGFWLKPHTDIGVKKLTMLVYLAEGPEQADLGTDLYADEATPVKRSVFAPNSAMMFLPAPNTWHGFEPRPIQGVRRSIIVNYVTKDWRAREQLAFPDTPVRARA